MSDSFQKVERPRLTFWGAWPVAHHLRHVDFPTGTLSTTSFSLIRRSLCGVVVGSMLYSPLAFAFFYAFGALDNPRSAALVAGGCVGDAAVASIVHDTGAEAGWARRDG